MDLQINGISFGATKQEVLDSFGASVVNSESDVYMEIKNDTISYSLRFDFFEGKVNFIKVASYE